jgi:SnoaL-like domain
MDEGQFDRLEEILTRDIVYDISALGGGQLAGIEAIAQAARSLGEANPLGHHVTNVVVLDIDGDRAWVRSKGLAVMSNGAAGSVVYDDELRRTDQGWRIAVRRVLLRKTPLQPSGAMGRDVRAAR